MKDEDIRKEIVSELTKKIIKLSDHLYPQKDEDIRKQIEEELKEYKCEYDNCTLCGDKEICNYLLDLFDSNNGVGLFKKLIEARKTIQLLKELARLYKARTQ